MNTWIHYWLFSEVSTSVVIWRSNLTVLSCSVYRKGFIGEKTERSLLSANTLDRLNWSIQNIRISDKAANVTRVFVVQGSNFCNRCTKHVKLIFKYKLIYFLHEWYTPRLTGLCIKYFKDVQFLPSTPKYKVEQIMRYWALIGLTIGRNGDIWFQETLPLGIWAWSCYVPLKMLRNIGSHIATRSADASSVTATEAGRQLCTALTTCCLWNWTRTLW